MYCFTCWLRCLVQFPWGSLDSLQATPVNFTALDADQVTLGRFFFFFFFFPCLEFVLHHGKLKFIGFPVKFPADRSKFLFCTTAWSNDNRLFCRFFLSPDRAFSASFFKGVYWCLLVTLSEKVYSFKRRLLRKRRKVRVLVRKGIRKNINRLLTEREGRTGEYWPEVVALRTERSEVCTATTKTNTFLITKYESIQCQVKV